jgi:hypothetical protein
LAQGQVLMQVEQKLVVMLRELLEREVKQVKVMVME